MIAWMIYCTVVGALVAGAALAGEQVARRVRVPARWGWAGAMAVTLALAALAPLRRPTIAVAAAQTSAVAPATPSAVPFEARVDALTRWLPSSITPFAMGAWAVASLALVALIFLVHSRMRRARREWPLADLHGARVRVSPSVGPAVIGVTRPEIIVPRWLLARDAEEQRLVVAHESEHVAAYDPVLLAAGCLACAVMPWNPATWFMFSRLRLAVELDCDARVLRGGVAVHSYGTLLIDVAVHASPPRFGAPGLVDSPSHLHQRILAMKHRVPRFARLRATVAGLFAAGALVAACEAKMPTATEVEGMDVAKAEAQARASNAAPRTRLGNEANPVTNVARRFPGDGDAVPLVLIDGLRGKMEEFKKLNPKDIESVEVVKGMAAAAEYGPDAEKGVIVIRTKKPAAPQ